MLRSLNVALATAPPPAAYVPGGTVPAGVRAVPGTGGAGGGAGVYEDENGLPVFLTPQQATEMFFAEALRAETRLRICQHCTNDFVFYREMQNVGQLACRFHPGALVDGRYACCGAAYGPAGDGRGVFGPNEFGCVPCDHTPPVDEAAPRAPRYTFATMTTKIPYHLRAYYAPHQDLVVGEHIDKERPERSWLRVLRVHRAYYEEQRCGTRDVF